jgi:hypothetical protein
VAALTHRQIKAVNHHQQPPTTATNNHQPPPTTTNNHQHCAGADALAAVAALQDKQIKAVNLSREWLSVLLPHVMSKINRVSYGLLSAEQVGCL